MVALIAYTTASADAQSTKQSPDLEEIIFDLPCGNLVIPSAEDGLTQNMAISSIFVGFIVARATEDEARAMLTDIFSLGFNLGGLCTSGDRTLYEAMGVVVEEYLAGN